MRRTAIPAVPATEGPTTAARVPGGVLDLAAYERVRDAALAAAREATDVRATVHGFVVEHHDVPVLRRVLEGLALDLLRDPDDHVLRGAEALVSVAIASIGPMAMTR